MYLTPDLASRVHSCVDIGVGIPVLPCRNQIAQWVTRQRSDEIGRRDRTLRQDALGPARSRWPVKEERDDGTVRAGGGQVNVSGLYMSDVGYDDLVAKRSAVSAQVE